MQIGCLLPNSILAEGRPYLPPYHKSVCCCHKVRATPIKVPDIVPIDNCQLPKASFGVCFFKRIKKFDVQNFVGSSSISLKLLFSLTITTFLSSIWIVRSQFSFERWRNTEQNGSLSFCLIEIQRS